MERRGREALYDLREVIAYRTQPERIEKLNLEAERARLAKKQADKTAMENAERRAIPWPVRVPMVRINPIDLAALTAWLVLAAVAGMIGRVFVGA